MVPRREIAADDRIYRTAAPLAVLLNHHPTAMTKRELLALAASGNAIIEVAYTITRYCVTPPDDPDGLHAAIFISISNEDGSVYNDDGLFTITSMRSTSQRSILRPSARRSSRPSRA